VLREFVSGDTALPRDVAPDLPQRIVRAWREAVASHATAHPFTADEWRALQDAASPGGREEIEGNPAVAYGATLLAVAVRDSSMVYLQLGDGDILCVNDAGDTTRVLDADPRLIGNQTTSLCQGDAAECFRTRLVADGTAPPALVLVATDGYANAFRSDADFRLIGRDYLTLLREQGLDGTAARLDRFLNDASANGSGDDITLGLMAHLGPHPADATPRSDVAEKRMAALDVRPRDVKEDVPARARRHEQVPTRPAGRPRSAVLGLIVALAVAAAVLGPRLASLRHGGPPARPMPAALVLHAGKVAIPLAVGRKVLAQDLSLDPATSGDPVAEVVPSPDGNGIQLKNVSKVKWAVSEGGKSLDVTPGSAIAVAPGVRIRVETAAVTIDRK